MKRFGLGPIAPRQDGHGATLITQLARKFLNHRRLACPADSQIANRNHLNPERGIPQDSNIVEKPTGFDSDLEDFRERKKQRAHDRGTRSASFLKDNLQEEGFKTFGPDPKLFTHSAR